MSQTVIEIRNLSKMYRLGEVSTGTLSHDLNRWWHKVRGKEDPFLKLGQENKRDAKGGDYVWALKDVNFDVKQGEVLGIIGKNGAGKSTLLKILSRVTAPTTGTFKAKGRIASLLEVGTGFHPDLTGRENIFLNGAILGMTKTEIKRKFDEIIDFAGVERYVDTPVKRYSSGMYVRLAFGVAAHLESEILIIDEVLSVGDAEFQKKCLGKMSDISKSEGRTVLFVSHNMGSIQTLCDKGIILDNGKTRFEGNITDAINEYNSSYNKYKSTVYNGNGTIKRAHIVTADNSIVKYNSEFKIEVSFNSKTPIKNLVLGFIIRDQFDVPLIGVNNRHYSNESLHINEISEGVVEVVFSSLSLLPGTYNVDIFLGDSIMDIEEVKDALCFEVEDTKINPTALQINTGINKLFFKNIDWKIKHV